MDEMKLTREMIEAFQRQTEALESIATSLRKLEVYYAPRFLVDMEQPAAESLVQKLGKSKPGEILRVDRDEYVAATEGLVVIPREPGMRVSGRGH